MAFRLRFNRRSSWWGPFRINFNKKGISLTTKIGPFSHTASTDGRRTTNVSTPVKGASFRSVSTAKGRHRGRSETPASHRGPSDEEREAEATREELRRRIAQRQSNIRALRARRRGQS